jgi:hypothetical protein
MKLPVSAWRRDGVSDAAARPENFGKHLRTVLMVSGDALLAMGIVAAALIGWSPRIGAAAARETLAARRAERSRIAEIERVHGAIWARHARRGIRPRGIVRIADGLSHPTSDP